MKGKKALICGIGGQDGAYLAKYLISKNYIVFGTSRYENFDSQSRIRMLGIYEEVNFIKLDLTDIKKVISILQDVYPDEVYNLSGQSSVNLSFLEPFESMKSIITVTLNLLEAIRKVNRSIRYYSAGSGEIYGETIGNAFNENSFYEPRSPYAISKVASLKVVENYRNIHGLHASTGILFSHESPLRSLDFVIPKIVNAAARIYLGEVQKLEIGNLNIERDWGWAPEYVESMWLMLQHDYPDDYIIATGYTSPLSKVLLIAFNYFGLDWRSHVKVNESLYRPSDIISSKADPSKAKFKLNWSARFKIEDIIVQLCDRALKNLLSDKTHK